MGKNHLLTYLKLILVSLFWGGTFIATRIATNVFQPFTGATSRYFIAILFLIPIAYFRYKNFFRITFRQFGLFFLIGLSGIFAYNFFFFQGLKSIPASRGALIVALNPTMVLIISSIIYREKITLQKAMGIILSLCGVVMVISRGHLMEIFNQIGEGDLYMFGCPVSWAIYTIVGRETLKVSTPLVATAWGSVLGIILLFIFSFSETYPDVVPLNVWLSIIYLGVFGTVIAFVWYYDGIKQIGPSRASIFNNLVPVFALMLSGIILKESISWYSWIGILFVISGIITSNIQFQNQLK